jgi:hypothetical protein
MNNDHHMMVVVTPVMTTMMIRLSKSTCGKEHDHRE